MKSINKVIMCIVIIIAIFTLSACQSIQVMTSDGTVVQKQDDKILIITGKYKYDRDEYRPFFNPGPKYRTETYCRFIVNYNNKFYDIPTRLSVYANANTGDKYIWPWWWGSLDPYEINRR